MLRACRLFEFIENELKVRTKKPVPVKGPDGQVRMRQIVPLHLNAVQQLLAQELALAWHREKPFRRLIPKARQMGISTFFQAIFFALCLNRPGYKVQLVAHHEDGGLSIFSKSHTFLKHLRPEVSRPLSKCQGALIEWENASATSVASIKLGDRLGKGTDYSGIHYSEVANFADQGIDAVNASSSIFGGLADDPMLIVVWESTAKGRDPFFWAECERALDPNVPTENGLIFLPWFLEPGYSMSWTTYRKRLEGRKLPLKFVPNEQERLLRRQIANTKVDASNRNYRYRLRLTDEQLIWRRFILSNECFDRVDLFQRYYPSTYEEAFTSTVQCMFDRETVDHYMANSAKPAATGNFLPAGEHRAEFKANLTGHTRLWCDAAPGEEYVIGADVGGERKGSDPCAAYVLNVYTMEVCAAIHGHMEFDEWADYLMLAGKYFNNARLAIENNWNPAVAKTCFKAGYPNLYHYVDEASLKLHLTPKPGFNTNRKTRPEMLSYLDQVTRDRTLICKDKGFAREMEFFVWDEKKETHRASGSFHDDRIMAMAIAVYVNQAALDRAVADPKRDYGWAYRLYLEMEDTAEDPDGEKVHLL